MLRIVNAKSGATREVSFECFHDARKVIWVELRFGVAGVYNFSLLTGWQEHKRSETPAWYLDRDSFAIVRAQAIAAGHKLKDPLWTEYPPPPAKPRAPKSRRQSAKPAQTEMFK